MTNSAVETAAVIVISAEALLSKVAVAGVVVVTARVFVGAKD